MKDEYNNECPYDFKNLLLCRDMNWFQDNDEFVRKYLDEAPYWDMYFYTFSYWTGELYDENRGENIPKDLTMMSNHCVRDNKIICSAERLTYDGDITPNNVFIYISSYYDDDCCYIQSNTLINSRAFTFLGTEINFNNIVESVSGVLGEYSHNNNFTNSSDLMFVQSQYNHAHNCNLIQNTGVSLRNNYLDCIYIRPYIPDDECDIIDSTFMSVHQFMYDTSLTYVVVKPGSYDYYAVSRGDAGSTIALKSNGKIVVYNEADLIADQY